MNTDANEEFMQIEAWLRQREEHYQQHFGPIIQPIMHSSDAVDPHIDIYQFPPYGDRDYWTLITGGMSNLAQTLADGTQHYTELLMYVREPRPWMFHALKVLAEFPARYQTFFFWGHTIDYGRLTQDVPTRLTAFLLLPPYFERTGFDSLQIDGDPVHFLWCVPITAQEQIFAKEHGGMALAHRMEMENFAIVVDENRESLPLE